MELNVFTTLVGVQRTWWSAGPALYYIGQTGTSELTIHELLVIGNSPHRNVKQGPGPYKKNKTKDLKVKCLENDMEACWLADCILPSLHVHIAVVAGMESHRDTHRDTERKAGQAELGDTRRSSVCVGVSGGLCAPSSCCNAKCTYFWWNMLSGLACACLLPDLCIAITK